MKSNEALANRLYAAVVTPYQHNSFTVDENAMRSLLRYFMQPKFINAGGGIVINPEAGELVYLNMEEKVRNMEIAMEECGGKVPVFAGVGGLTTEEAVQLAVKAKEIGVDGLFLMPPFGMADLTISWDAEKYPEIWIDMAKDIFAAVDLPAIAHPVASVTPTYGIGLPVGATRRMLHELPNIIAWKMTYKYDGYRIIARAIRELDRHVGILPSTAKNFHEILSTEMMDGVLTGSFNYGMEPIIDHIEAWKKEDLKEARRIWNSGAAALHEYVYSDYTRLHIRYKIATWLRGLIPHPLMRPPLPKPKKEEVAALAGLLRGAGLNVIDDQDIERVTSTLQG